MVELATFVANASPISSIGIEALIPVLIVTIMLIGALDAPPAKVAPTGKAIRVTVFNGGAELTQVAANGPVERGEVV